MPRPSDHTLWHTLRLAWLAAATARPAGPGPAEEAGLPARPIPRVQPVRSRVH